MNKGLGILKVLAVPAAVTVFAAPASILATDGTEQTTDNTVVESSAQTNPSDQKVAVIPVEVQNADVPQTPVPAVPVVTLVENGSTNTVMKSLWARIVNLIKSMIK